MLRRSSKPWLLRCGDTERRTWRVLLTLVAGLVASSLVTGAAAAPAPLITKDKPVDWWFVYKFSAPTDPTSPTDSGRDCPFGGTVQAYPRGFSQAYALASSYDPIVKSGTGLVGVSDRDPVGATFGAMYSGAFSYVVFNDQFEDAPPVPGCVNYCDSPWAHSKGMVAWDDQGNGIVIQVTTPSWPGSGGVRAPRVGDGNTLGCVKRNNLLYAQHFFALRLSPADTGAVLRAAYNAGVPTLPNLQQLVHLRPGSPQELTDIAKGLGDSTPLSPAVLDLKLSSGVRLISKPASLNVPPWHLVSATLGGEPIRVASWLYGEDGFPSTKPGVPGCWAPGIGTPGRVESALTGTWKSKPIALTGGGRDGNHAKIGVSLTGHQNLAIFGDLNQTGGLRTKCDKSQNARGGLFFVVQDVTLAGSIRSLLQGKTSADGDRTVAEGAEAWRPTSRRRGRR